MISILFVIVKCHSKQFKSNYLRNKKSFSNFFAPFLKTTSNFEQFETKDDPYSLCIFEIREWNRRGYKSV